MGWFSNDPEPVSTPLPAKHPKQVDLEAQDNAMLTGMGIETGKGIGTVNPLKSNK